MSIQSTTDYEKWMNEALAEAKESQKREEVPVGAVIVLDNQIIGRGRNRVRELKDPTAHAEILAIQSASNTIQSYQLNNADIYVTLEPCSMCAGAIVLAKLRRLIYGTTDPKTGACGSIFNLVQSPFLNHRVDIVSDILQEECSTLLKDFFKGLRTR